VSYRTILADPPWSYDEGFAFKKSDGTIEHQSLPYPSMTLEEIAAMPVGDLVSNDGAWLWLWTTNRYLPASLDIAAGWGFKYSQTLVWWKRDAQPLGGAVAPVRAEFIILAATPKHPKLTGRIESSVLPHVRSGLRHSQKPEAFQYMIEQVSPGPRLEIFARRKLRGWDVWGNEVECSDAAVAVLGAPRHEVAT
jgi:N6-adenosine-specific RNA methylase IME4